MREASRIIPYCQGRTKRGRKALFFQRCNMQTTPRIIVAAQYFFERNMFFTADDILELFFPHMSPKEARDLYRRISRNEYLFETKISKVKRDDESTHRMRILKINADMKSSKPDCTQRYKPLKEMDSLWKLALGI